jgi:hypothetical protein
MRDQRKARHFASRACGLAAWTIVGVALVIGLILLVTLGWMEGVYSKELKRSSTVQQKKHPKECC